jgi:predicted nuclease of predicted toxin-antitoxin system
LKLLFDQHLSPRLVKKLEDIFPNSSHVATLGLATAFDAEIWEAAKHDGYTILTKDVDFSELNLLRGFPPKVLWLQVGNCSTADVEGLIRGHESEIRAFEANPSYGVLRLG